VVPIVPDLDILLKAFSRQTPEPLVVLAFTRHVTDRRIHLVGWVRQGLLSRTADDRQFDRLNRLLEAFPDLRVLSTDHLQAARLSRRLRERSVTVSPWQALLWTVAERIGGVIWSGDRRWLTLQSSHCPLL
jgi:hypothetical protein